MSKQVEAEPEAPKKTRRRLTDEEHEERARAKLEQIAERREKQLLELLGGAISNLRAASDIARTLQREDQARLIDRLRDEIETVAT